MNTQQRAQILSKFKKHVQKTLEIAPPSPLSRINSHLRRNQKKQLNPHPMSALDVDIIKELVINQSQIAQNISHTHKQIQGVLSQINLLKNKKENIEKLLDSMTAINQVKRLSLIYGAESTQQADRYVLASKQFQPEEVEKDLQNYYAIKQKCLYCNKYITLIEKGIVLIEQQFKEKFEEELGNVNSANGKKGQNNKLSPIAKLIQLIQKNRRKTSDNMQQVEQNHQTATIKQLCAFYTDILRKQFKSLEQQLFKIPIVGTNIQSSYLFFQIAKDAMKIVANTIKTFQDNILKLTSKQGLHQVIIQLFNFTLQNIILEILRRQKKFFEIDKIAIDPKKLFMQDKDFVKLTHYLSQFNAIWNQVQRLKFHLQEQIDEKQYSKYDDYWNELQHATNSAAFVEFNAGIILFMQAYQRHQFDRLIKKSVFINSIWQLDSSFFKQIEKQQKQLAKKKSSNNTQFDCQQGIDFLQESTSYFVKGVEKSFETLNILIISPVINYTNNNLINEDAFYTFNQLFNRTLNKMPSSDTKPYKAICLIINTLSFFPNALKSFSHVVVPEQIDQQRLSAQIQQLINSNTQKCKSVINKMFNKLTQSEWFIQQFEKLIQSDNLNAMKKILQKWSLLHKSVMEILILKVAQLHSQLYKRKTFPTLSNSSSKNLKNYDQSWVINSEKQIRNIISQYQKYTATPILAFFKDLLSYFDILLMENEQEVTQYLNRIQPKKSEEQIAKIKYLWTLRQV